MKLDDLWIYLEAIVVVVVGEERGARDGIEVDFGEGVAMDLKSVEAGLEIERYRDAIAVEGSSVRVRNTNVEKPQSNSYAYYYLPTTQQILSFNVQKN